MVKKLLYVSWLAPYSNVRHAGGQTLNYYIKGIDKKRFEVSLLTFCMPDEINDIDTEQENINTHLIIREKGFADTISNVVSINSKINPLHRYANLLSAKSALRIRSKLIELQRNGYEPDIIILEWTEMVILIDLVKNIFPDAKIIASEHDVTFQRIEREAKTESSKFKYLQYNNTKKRELTALSKCDKILTHNEKDRRLLLDNGIENEKVRTIVPYYHRSLLDYRGRSNKILFFGNMRRKENAEADNWFRSNVLPKIEHINCKYETLGIGAKFVENIDDEFSEAMCFVCPMQHGAGIKVKNIEALYAGVPVLTNQIGIEGIPAIDGKDYLLCETPDDYQKAIEQISNKNVVVSGKAMITKEFNLEKSMIDYQDIMCRI